MDSLDKCEVSFASRQCSYACRKMSITQSACRMREARTQIARKMSYVNVRVHESLMQQIQARQLEWQTTTGVVNDLLASALDSTLTLNVPSRQAPGPTKGEGSSKEEEETRAREELINRPPTPAPKAPKDPWSVKKVSLALVPEDIDGNHAELFVEWWAVRNKGAVRSEKVAYREFDKLRAWNAKDRTSALQKAISGGWKQLYMPEEVRKPNTPQEPETRHPAYRDAREIIREQEAQFNNIPSATGGLGVLEPGAF